MLEYLARMRDTMDLIVTSMSNAQAVSAYDADIYILFAQVINTQHLADKISNTLLLY